MTASVSQWAALAAIVAGLFAADLLLGRRRSDHPSVRSLVLQNVAWFAIGMAFTVLVWTTWQEAGNVAAALEERCAGWAEVRRLPFELLGADVPEL
jgi:hypothetical protein